MATSIIGGLLAKGFEAKQLCVSDPLADNRERLAADFSIKVVADNSEAAKDADVLILAVKPQVMRMVCEDLSAHLSAHTMVISIAAGATTQNLSTWLGDDKNNIAIVRCMPNTPALVQAGATGAVANQAVSAEQKQLADTILKAVGIVEWLDDEAHIDAVTAVSGSAPAYFFLLLEAMVHAAEQQGLPETVARNLAVQTCVGAGLLAQADDTKLSALRRRVTSPGGTTEKAVEAMQHANFEKIVKDAMDACQKRSIELAD